MNRRKFLRKTAQAALVVQLLRSSAANAASAAGDEALPSPSATGASPLAPPRPKTARLGWQQHRFGVDYVPAEDWWYCWNDFKPDSLARDLDAVAKLSADHIRIMVMWTYFQPNPGWVSPAHLERLDQLMRLAAERNLDVCVSMLVGHLTGQNFRQGYEKGSFFSAPAMIAAQNLYFAKVAEVCRRHANFLGFDLGNELNCCWKTDDLAEGDRWFENLMDLAEKLAPEGVHVNGVDHGPWFHPATFSPQALARRQKIISIHAWTKYTGALDRGGPLNPPSVQLLAAMGALARAYAGEPQKPVWIQEFGASEEWMTPAQIETFVEKTILAAIDTGVNWFTFWASHDLDRKFKVGALEYSMGLITVDNKIKKRGEIFKRIAEGYRGKDVKIPPAYQNRIPEPPREYSDAGTWTWLSQWMNRAA